MVRLRVQLRRTVGLASGFSSGLLLAGLLASSGCGESDSRPTTPGPDALVGETAVEMDSAEPANDDSATSPPAGEMALPSAADEQTGSDIALPPSDLPEDSDDSKSPGSGFRMPDVNVPPPESGASSVPPEIRFATWDDVQATIGQGGRVTVVDLWALSCGPCLKEFPGLVQLHRELGDSVRCIGFDVDYDGRATRPPESYRADISAFLSSVNANFENYISRTPNEGVFDAVGIGSIPAVLVYDGEGKLVKRFADVGETAGFTYDNNVIPLVRQLAG